MDRKQVAVEKFSAFESVMVFLMHVALVGAVVICSGCSKGWKFSVGVTPVSAIDETQKFEAEDSVGLVSQRKPRGERY